uniref:PUB domain-containing protein n=1 Tax=Panagrellus redivivus TaxID=6233 RepID=A0A7E4V5M7_PANRE
MGEELKRLRRRNASLPAEAEDANQKIATLTAEVEDSKKKIATLEERLAVFETKEAQVAAVASRHLEFRNQSRRQFQRFWIIVLIIFHVAVVHNCTRTNPWIPRSEGYCEDASHLLSTFEFRPSYCQNFRLVVHNLIAFGYQQVSGYAQQQSDHILAIFNSYWIKDD